MASVNKVILVGNCGKDPEVRYLPSGGAVAQISLATTSKRKDKTSGETIEDTQWHRLVLYERLAEIAGEYIKKGSPIYVEGRLKYGKYTGQDGVERYTTDIVVTELQLLGKREDGQGQRPPAPSAAPQRNEYAEQKGRSAAPVPKPGRGGGSGFDDMDDDIPF